MKRAISLVLVTGETCQLRCRGCPAGRKEWLRTGYMTTDMAGDAEEPPWWNYPVKWWSEIVKPLALAALAMVCVWALLYGFTKLFNWALPAMFGPKFI